MRVVDRPAEMVPPGDRRQRLTLATGARGQGWQAQLFHAAQPEQSNRIECNDAVRAGVLELICESSSSGGRYRQHRLVFIEEQRHRADLQVHHLVLYVDAGFATEGQAVSQELERSGYVRPGLVAATGTGWSTDKPDRTAAIDSIERVLSDKFGHWSAPRVDIPRKYANPVARRPPAISQTGQNCRY